jgi:hypothetical protein
MELEPVRQGRGEVMYVVSQPGVRFARRDGRFREMPEMRVRRPNRREEGERREDIGQDRRRCSTQGRPFSGLA